MTTVLVAGADPAADAVVDAVEDGPATAVRGGVEEVSDADLAVVVGVVGGDGFRRANRLAADAGVPWLAVEVGGVGGRAFADLSAAVTGLGPGGPCHDCLRGRVAAATAETDADPSAPRRDVRFAGAVAGRLAAAHAAGESVVGRCVEVPHAERSLLPLPGCETCGTGDGPRAVERVYEDVALPAAIDRAERAVDDRLGVATEVGERESFPAPYYLASSCDTSGFSDASAGRQAAGVAADWNPAYMKALGEALERYGAGVYRAADARTAPAADVTNPVRPSSFVRPDGAPDPDPDDPLDWLPARHLGTGERAHVPADCAWYPPPDGDLCPPITTGLGLGTSPDGAVRSGLREVLERDATMLAWYSTFEPLGLEVADEAFDALARRAGAEDLTVTPLLVTQDVDVPVVAVAVHRDGEWPRFAAGSAAALDPDEAARGALEEAVQNWMELRGMGPDRAAEAEGAIGEYADFPRAVREFVAPETTVAAADVGPVDPPAGADAVDALVSRAGAADLDAYAVDLTPRDVRAAGFTVVRVLVPGAQPLFVDPERAAFGDRARRVPRELGYRPRLDRGFHPYP